MEIPVKIAEALEILKGKGHMVGEPTSSVAGGIIVPIDDKRLNESEIFKLAEMVAPSGRPGASNETP